MAAETNPCEKKELLEKDFDIPMSSEMDEEENIMCNLGAGIREQATIETHLNDIINLMTSLNLSADKAADALKIPNEEKHALLAMIDRQLITK